MLGRFNYLKRDKIANRSYLLSFFLLALTCICSSLFYGLLPPVIPVFNQLPWGIQRLGDKFLIFLPLAFSSLMLLFNIIYSGFIYEKMPLVVRMIGITAFFISLITCIYTLRTVMLVY